VTPDRPDRQTEVDLERIKFFFEELIGCVVGCGCWEPSWDREASVTEFARDGFATWGEGPAPTPGEILDALDRCFANLSDADMEPASQWLELSFANAEDFRKFFANARRTLTECLRPASN
jgi:hypothetical protein